MGAATSRRNSGQHACPKGHRPPEIARTLVRAAAQTLRKRARRIDKDSAPDDYHEVRIRAKRLRYTLDAFAELYGEAAQSYAKALGKLQTVLGEYNDATVREKRFTELVTGGPRLPASTSFLAGRLVERDVQAFKRCRKKFGRAYRRVRGRRWNELNDDDGAGGAVRVRSAPVRVRVWKSSWSVMPSRMSEIASDGPTMPSGR